MFPFAGTATLRHNQVLEGARLPKLLILLNWRSVHSLITAYRERASLLALVLDAIDEAKLQMPLREFMSESGDTRIFKLRDFGPESFLLDVGVDDFFYNGAEGNWISEPNEWIIYCSHEGTMTLGGSIADVAKNGFQM